MDSNQMPNENFDRFGTLLGMHCQDEDRGKANCKLTVREDHLNRNGVVHGGVVYALADTAMGWAVLSALPEEMVCATIEIKITYFKPIAQGELACKATVIYQGRKVASIDAEIWNEERLVAKANGTFYIFKRENLG
ncbi:MAG: PaaI family thioesterase [Chloroflexota bacterium]